MTESNAFLMLRDAFLALGGYDERFTSPGGGLCNLDFFKRAQAHPPVALLGEATFHQFHGGVASNVPPGPEHPRTRYLAEWEDIHGEPLKTYWRRPMYLGHVPWQAEWVFGGPR